jgi:arylsulfatase A-like enzyme
MLNRRQFLGTLGAALPALAQTQKPNIVFILADDLGYGDLGCYGQAQIATPNLDRLASDGMRFTQSYAGSTVCAPSRCCLMTGMHTGHARIRGNSPDIPLRPEDRTIPELLKTAGYRTGMFGKWSLGAIHTTGYPTRKGFDEWFGFFNQTQAHTYYPEILADGDKDAIVRGNFGRKKKTDYAPDLFRERALKFLAKSQPEPFFLYYPSTIPHANNELGAETGNGLEVPEDAPYSSKDWPQVEKNFAAMVTRMDRDIGLLLDKLKETGADKNTLVLFSSDNGPHKEGGHSPDFFHSSGPLRGIKRALYDGGIRVPLIARWPGRIKPGSTNDHVCAFWDYLPTLSEVAGVASPRGIDGISFLPALLGRPQQKHEYLYWEFHEGGFIQAVRSGDWKLVSKELYDLKSDLGEKTDVASQHPDVAVKLAQFMASARTDSTDFPIRQAPRRAKKTN